MRCSVLWGILVFISSCASDPSLPLSSTKEQIGGSRPLTVYAPPSYQEGVPMPLLMALHGYSSSAEVMESYLHLEAIADSEGFLLVTPNGKRDAFNNRFWNATDACCDFFGTQEDDSGYLRMVIEEIQAEYSVDAKRIFVLGHSNGAFMSHRLACDHADLIAGIVSLAGATFQDASRCQPTEAVHMLQIHGTSDGIIRYEGGETVPNGVYPGAVTTTERWAALNKCQLTTESGENLDLDSNLIGAESSVLRYDTSCAGNVGVELWTIEGGEHIPAISASFVPAVVSFLLTHPKPGIVGRTSSSDASSGR